MDATPVSSISKTTVDKPGAQASYWLQQGDHRGQHGCAGHWGLLYTDHDTGVCEVSTTTTWLV